MQWSNEALLKYFAQRLISPKGFSKGTVRTYVGRIRTFFREIGMEVVDLTPSQISDWWIHYSGRTPKRNTRALQLNAVKSFLSEVRHIDPRLDALALIALAIRPVKHEIITPHIFSEEDLFRMITAAASPRYDVPKEQSSILIPMRDAAIVAILADTGLRSSELRALEMRNITIRYPDKITESPSYIVSVPAIKTNIARQIPFGRLSAGSLIGETFSRYYLFMRDVVKHAPHMPLFPVIFKHANTGMSLSSSGVRRIIGEIVRRAGVSDTITPHSFRHWFGTYCRLNGMDIHEIQMLMGHANITTTVMYIHLADLQRFNFNRGATANLPKAPAWMTGTVQLQQITDKVKKDS